MCQAVLGTEDAAGNKVGLLFWGWRRGEIKTSKQTREGYFRHPKCYKGSDMG